MKSGDIPRRAHEAAACRSYLESTGFDLVAVAESRLTAGDIRDFLGSTGAGC